MVDITSKPDIVRIAKASGKIFLKKGTIEKIERGEIKKGDVFEVSRVAATLAVKNTPQIIPLCHPINITNVKVDFIINEDSIEAIVEVKAKAPTGVEMEALHGVLTALLNIWDMVKYLEKDERGNYPTTEIGSVKVISKVKIENEASG